MRVLRNFTLHDQGAAEKAIAAAAGYDLIAAPEGVLVPPGESGLRQAAAELAARLRNCAAAGEAVLVGGHTGAFLAAILTLTAADGPIPELWYFDTRRVRDANGRFVFMPEQLIRVAPCTGEGD